MGASCSSCSELVEDPADPDIVGFGVLAAFIFPVLASHVFIVLAYVASSVNRHQHAQLDEMLYPRIRSVTSRWRVLRKLEYQHIILPLGDQLLITGIALAVTVYSQICTISVYSFNVSNGLIALASGVHMDCLVTLGPYFHNHSKQSMLRIGLMGLQLVFIIATEILVYVLINSNSAEVSYCALKHNNVNLTENHVDLVAQLIYCYWIFMGYYDAIVFLRDSKYDFTPAYTAVIRLTGLFYRSPQRKKEFRALERGERKRIWGEYMRQCDELRRTKSLWKRWRIALPVLVDDGFRSVLWNIYSSFTLTVYLLVCLMGAIFRSDVDASPLLEPKFGQIIPLFLPVVFILAVFEASSNEKNQTDTRQSANKDQALSPEIELVERQNADPASGNGRRGSSETLEEHATNGVSEDIEPALARVVRRVMRRNKETPQLAVSGRNSDHEHPTISATDTSRLEDSNDPSSDEEKDKAAGQVKARMLLARAVHEEAPVLTGAFVCLAFAGQILFVLALVYDYATTIITYFGVTVLSNAIQTCDGFRCLWKARREMRRKRLARRTGTGTMEMAATRPG